MNSHLGSRRSGAGKQDGLCWYSWRTDVSILSLANFTEVMVSFLGSGRTGQCLKAWGLSRCRGWAWNSRLNGDWSVLRHGTPKSGKELLSYSSPLSMYVIPEKRGDERNSFANPCGLLLQCLTFPTGPPGRPWVLAGRSYKALGFSTGPVNCLNELTSEWNLK